VIVIDQGVGAGVLANTLRQARDGRGDREQEAVELNSKAPVRDERNKRKKVYR